MFPPLAPPSISSMGTEDDDGASAKSQPRQQERPQKPAGAVTFTEDFVFRSRVTEDKRRKRAMVIAHEMSHVRNYDIRLMTVIAALVGTLALLSDWAGRMGRVAGGTRRSRSSSRDGGIVLCQRLTVQRRSRRKGQQSGENERFLQALAQAVQ
mgnify:CR=1 FL=1